MIEIRFHGRGGQGAVTSAEILAQAAIEEGRYATAFPSFGSERRGAPVLAFTRIADEKIRLRTGIYEPDIVIVLDPTLIESQNVTSGLKKDGVLVLNTKKDPEFWQEKLGNFKICTVGATTIAMEELGVPITNVIMLGALINATSLVKPEMIEKRIAERFPKIADKEIRAFQRAIKESKVLQ